MRRREGPRCPTASRLSDFPVVPDPQTGDAVTFSDRILITGGGGGGWLGAVWGGASREKTLA